MLFSLGMSLSSTQTYIAKKSVKWLNENYDLDASIQGIRYVFPNRIRLEKIMLPDYVGDTLMYAKRISLEVDFYDNLNKELSISNVLVNGYRFKLSKKDSIQTNISYFTQKFKSDKVSETSFKLKVKDATLRDSHFSFDSDLCPECFSMNLKKINGNLEVFQLDGANFNLITDHLNFYDPAGFTVVNMSGAYDYQANSMSLNNFELNTEESVLKGDYSLEYNSINDFSYFLDKVKMKAKLKECRLISSDVKYFSNSYPDFPLSYFSGEVDGVVNALEVSNIDLRTANNTELIGDIKVFSPTNMDSLNINLNEISLNTTITDLRIIANAINVPLDFKELNSLEQINLNGSLFGPRDALDANLNLNTSLGNIRLDALLGLSIEANDISYDGDIEVLRLELGELSQQSNFGMLSGKFKLKGKGFNPQSMNSNLLADVDLLEIMDYPYSGIKIDGLIGDAKFNGALDISDPNLQLHFNGIATLNTDTSEFAFKSVIDFADLQALKLVKDESAILKTTITLDFKAIDYDKWNGDIAVFNTSFENDYKAYFLEEINIKSNSLTSDRKTLNLESKYLQASLEGQYTFENIAQSIIAEINKYYGINDQVYPENTNYSLDLTILESTVLNEILLKDYYIGSNSNLKIRYSSNELFDASFKTAHFAYRDIELRKPTFIYKSKDSSSTASLFVPRIQKFNAWKIDSLAYTHASFKDSLHFNSSLILLDSIDSKFELSAGITKRNSFNDYSLFLEPSQFNLGEDLFKIQSPLPIFIDTLGAEIQFMSVSNENDDFTISGNISKNPYEILRVNVDHLGLDMLNYFIGSDKAYIKGAASGNILFSQILKEPKFISEIVVDSLSMNDTYLGKLSLGTNWSIEKDTVSINLSLLRGDLETFNGKGYYQARDEGNMDLNFQFNRLHLAAFNPLAQGIAENLRGYADGNVKLKGNRSKPELSGDLTLPKLAFTFSVLGSDYNVQNLPKLHFNSKEITFNDLEIRDTEYGTNAIMKGKLTHDRFNDFGLDFNIEAKDLLVLNTKADRENLYYGTAFASGKVDVFGPINDIKVQAAVKTGENTNFVLPLAASSNVKKSQIVSFINPNDTIEEFEFLNNKKIKLSSGVSLDFRMAINENARVQILIDDEGNQMQAIGAGNLQFTYDEAVEMRLRGTYRISEGEYNFSLLSAIKKNFEILDGSTVSWNGDPYDATLNISALYTTKADPSVISGVTSSTGRTLTEVYLYLTGPLTNPEINFDIKVPRASPTTQGLINSQMSDRDDATQQVFSLLATSSFSPESGIGGITNAGDLGYGYEYLANIAESFFGNFTGSYDISINYESGYVAGQSGAGSAEPLQEELELGVSKQFLDDRVTVNGTVGVPIGENTNTNIAGDFEIQYNITKDGKLRAKMFSRQLTNEYSTVGVGQSQTYQQGIGAFYRMDFNTWKDFVIKINPFLSKDTKLQKLEESSEMQLDKKEDKQKEINLGDTDESESGSSE